MASVPKVIYQTFPYRYKTSESGSWLDVPYPTQVYTPTFKGTDGGTNVPYLNRINGKTQQIDGNYYDIGTTQITWEACDDVESPGSGKIGYYMIVGFSSRSCSWQDIVIVRASDHTTVGRGHNGDITVATKMVNGKRIYQYGEGGYLQQAVKFFYAIVVGTLVINNAAEAYKAYNPENYTWPGNIAINRDQPRMCYNDDGSTRYWKSAGSEPGVDGGTNIEYENRRFTNVQSFDDLPAGVDKHLFILNDTNNQNFGWFRIEDENTSFNVGSATYYKFSKSEANKLAYFYPLFVGFVPYLYQPDETGYIKLGWNPPEAKVTSSNLHQEYIGQYQKTKYKVTYLNKQEQTVDKEFDYGTTIYIKLTGGSHLKAPNNTTNTNQDYDFILLSNTILINPKKEGYSFTGWEVNGSTFTATWRANNASVVYKPNISGQNDITDSLQVGSTQTTRPKNTFTPPPKRRFMKWNTKNDGTGISYNASQTFVVPENGLTLYAIWADFWRPCLIWIYNKPKRKWERYITHINEEDMM